MRLLNFKQDGKWNLGVATGKGILDTALLQDYSSDCQIPTNVDKLIIADVDTLESLQRRVRDAEDDPHCSHMFLNEQSLQWGPCVLSPSKIICVGLNYKMHANESQMDIPDYPVLFSKYNNTLTGHGQSIHIPTESIKVDYEAELAVVIGRRAVNVGVAEALSYVFGYCNANDVSARDLQFRTGQWLLGKSSDSFCPVGPYLVTADEILDPQNLEITCHVNGELRQHSNTCNMLFSCAEIISYVTRHLTLEPGDLILTGTPEGVILGQPLEEQHWLQDGDEVSVSIHGLGILRNEFVGS